jgi:putative transcriptional regulator
MGIVVKLDAMLARRRMSLTELSERVGVSVVNLSNLKRGCCRAIRFSTLEAICHELNCQPGDILEYKEEE